MIILIIIALAAGLFAGWRAAIQFNGNKMIEENIFLRNHVEQLKQTVSYFFEQAANNREIHNTTVLNHNKNLKQTLESINVLEIKEKENDNKEIGEVIKSIKSGMNIGISSSNVE